jgi:hypothetical protein
MSDEEDSLVMIASCLKAASENVLQAMDLRGVVSRPGNLTTGPSQNRA